MQRVKDIIWVWDISCPSTFWGNTRDTPTPKNFETITQHYALTLINYITLPKRTGNSVKTGNSPDLTWQKGTTKIDWENTLETLGSDHSILTITLHQNIKTTMRTNKLTQITNWEALR